jgi:hypothetical protein
MRYIKDKWWQFWLPVCDCKNAVETATWVEDMPSCGPYGTPRFGTAWGDWRWHEYTCPDCGKKTQDGHWT